MQLKKYPAEMATLTRIIALRSAGLTWEAVDRALGFDERRHGKVAHDACSAAVLLLGPDCPAKRHLQQVLRNTAVRKRGSKKTTWLVPPVGNLKPKDVAR